jgi:putative flippase GtrA
VGIPTTAVTSTGGRAAQLHLARALHLADRASLTRCQALMRLVRFNLTTGVVSILGNLLLMRLLVGQMHLPSLPPSLVSIAGCSLVNFLVSEFIVFRARGRSATRFLPVSYLP